MNLILFPFHSELKSFLGDNNPAERKVDGYPVFEIPSRSQWAFAICGQGKVEAALACRILAEGLRAKSVLLMGAATALQPHLKPGDCVMARECVEVDFKSMGEKGVNAFPRFRSPLNPIPSFSGLPFHLGTVLSADADLFDSSDKKRLGEEHQALAYAWEGAGFHRALRRLGIPGLEIRVITETVEEPRLAWSLFQDRVRSHFSPLQGFLPEWESLSSIR